MWSSWGAGAGLVWLWKTGVRGDWTALDRASLGTLCLCLRGPERRKCLDEWAWKLEWNAEAALSPFPGLADNRRSNGSGKASLAAGMGLKRKIPITGGV